MGSVQLAIERSLEMKKTFLVVAIFGLLFSAIAFAIAFDQVYRCPIDNSPLRFTGKMSNPGGVVAREYKCAYEHIFWVRARNF